MYRYKRGLIFAILLATIIAAVAIKELMSIAHRYNRKTPWATSLAGERDEFQLAGEKVISPYQFPVALSPNGKQILFKEKTANAFALRIYEKDSQLAKLNLDTSPWEISWDPSGIAISFLAETDKPGVYAVNVWWVGKNQVTTLERETTRNASFALRWSPDGKYLSYIAYGRDESSLILLAVHGSVPYIEKTIVDVDPDAGVTWSPNSQEVAFAQMNQYQPVIKIFNLKTANIRALAQIPDGEIKDLSWAPSVSSIAMTFRGSDDNHFRLALLSLDGQIRYCDIESGDAESPVWSSENSNDIEYILDNNSDQTLNIAHNCDRSRRLYYPASGSGRIQSDGYRHARLPFIEAESSGPPELIQVNPKPLPHFVKIKNMPISQPPPGKQLWLPESNHPVAAWLWSPAKCQKRNQAVIIVHGGPHLHESGEWEPLREALLNNGYTILALNYGGSSGYGKDYEDIMDLDTQAKDVLGAVQYLSTSQGINPERDIILASSYGSRVVLKALRLDPHLCKTVIFAPFLSGTNDREANRPIPFNGFVLAFHGRRDPISNPKTALTSLEKLFQIAVLKDRFYWRQFDKEGHGFNRISSLQEEYGTILCVSDGVSCPKTYH